MYIFAFFPFPCNIQQAFEANDEPCFFLSLSLTKGLFVAVVPVVSDTAWYVKQRRKTNLDKTKMADNFALFRLLGLGWGGLMLSSINSMCTQHVEYGAPERDSYIRSIWKE